MSGLAGPFWVRLVVTALILAYLASEIDFPSAGRAVLSIDRRYLVLVLGLVAIDRCVMILRWVLLLRSSRVQVTAGEAARIFLVSSFVGSFLPAGLGGDLARAYGLTRATANGNEALASVAIDRVLGILALVLMGAIGLAVTATGLTDWRVISAAALAIGASVAVFWADYLLDRVLPSHWRDTPAGARLNALSASLSRYRNRRGVVASVFTWSIAVQLLRIVQAYYLGVGLGLTVAFRHYLVFMPVGLLMLLIPVSISGFGLPQGVIVWLMRPLGVADEQAFALSTLIVLTGLAGNLPGLALWLLAREKSRKIN